MFLIFNIRKTIHKTKDLSTLINNIFVFIIICKYILSNTPLTIWNRVDIHQFQSQPGQHPHKKGIGMSRIQNGGFDK